MKKISTAVLTGLFLIALAGLSSAGMMDDVLKKSDEAAQSVNEANTKAQDAGEKAKSGQDAIEAKGAAKEEAGDMSQQLREAAKEKSNETIDSIGR